jgi:diguanylate cyclase (GGDEF)-like protein/PAS domain S-box-containing protein
MSYQLFSQLKITPEGVEYCQRPENPVGGAPESTLTIERLSYSNSLTDAALESSTDGILIVDRDGQIVRWNQKFAELWHIPADLLNANVEAPMLKFATVQMTHPDDFLAKVMELYEHPEESSQDLLTLADGRLFERYSQPLRIGPEIVGRFWSFRDITSRRNAEEKVRLMAQVFEHSGEAIVITNENCTILTINSSFTRLTGYNPNEVVGQKTSMLKSGREPGEFYASMWAALVKDNYWQGEIWGKHKSGRIYPKWLALSVVRNDKGKITNFIGSFTDITEQKQAAQKIEHLAHYDALTNLPNRFSLIERLAQALEQARRSSCHLAVLVIDLDRFKNINDSLGHYVGDKLLFHVAARLLESVRSSDIVARLGGDEFVVVLPHIQSGVAAAHIVNKIQTALTQTYQLEGHNLYVTPSIGISVFPHDGETTYELMKNADLAMYHAKSKGRNNYQFFKHSMNDLAHERLLLESDLLTAIERNEFLLHYQPQIEMGTGRVIGVEALVRWQHHQRGLVPPDQFIPLAEETGLILPIGEWVLREACRQLKAWQSEGVTNLKMAINLSARQFKQSNLPQLVAGIIAESGIDANLLEFEITESAAMDNPEATIRHLRSFKEMGVDLAIDDFGTGYSSLNYLKLFPVNRLKIDKSFVKDIETDSDDAAIAAATIALAHTLGKQVVAEGVESRAQLNFLTLQQCDVAQGFYFSRPLPAGELAGFVKHHRSGNKSRYPEDSVCDNNSNSI